MKEKRSSGGVCVTVWQKVSWQRLKHMYVWMKQFTLCTKNLVGTLSEFDLDW